MKATQIIIFVLIALDCQSQTQNHSERDKYFGYDTLLINEYLSENGHKIRLEGSESKDTYRIVVQSKQGNIKTFQIAETWYGAAHSSILWDNDNYIFVRYGCGTSCWGGLILSLNDNRGIINYPEYIYVDRNRTLIVYPDANDLETIIAEDFTTHSKVSTKLDLCSETAVPILLIDTIYINKLENLTVRYKGTNCDEIREKELIIENIRN